MPPRRKRETLTPDELRRSTRRIVNKNQPVVPAKKPAAVKKPIAKSKKSKVAKGKANDSNQEPSATPAQNGENKEA